MIFDDLDIGLSTKPIIKVIGVGGAGGNAVDRMIENDVAEGISYIRNLNLVFIRRNDISQPSLFVINKAYFRQSCVLYCIVTQRSKHELYFAPCD